MGDTLPTYWRKRNEPDAGIFELITLAGWHPEGREGKVFYIVKSLEGFLNEAFEWSDVGKTWVIDFYYDPDDENPLCTDCDTPIGRDGCLCPPADAGKQQHQEHYGNAPPPDEEVDPTEGFD